MNRKLYSLILLISIMLSGCTFAKVQDKLPAFPFVEQYAKLTGTKTDIEEMAIIANGLHYKDQKVLDTLWDWTINSELDVINLSNREFILYLYNNILGRDEPNPEGWASRVEPDGDMTHKQIFDYFLTCPEFRNRRGLE